MNVSIIDWLGVYEQGIGLNLSLKVSDDKIYKFVYWFNKSGDFRLIADDEFKKDYNIDNLYEMEFSLILLKYIENNVLPKKEEIFREFKI